MRDAGKLLTVDQFRPLVNQVFSVRIDGAAEYPLTLLDASLLPRTTHPAERASFSLRFKGPAAHRLPQSIHALSKEGFGSLEVFLVPVGADERNIYYQAIFS